MTRCQLATSIASIRQEIPTFSTNPYLTLSRKRLEAALDLLSVDERRAAFVADEAYALLRYAAEYEAVQKLRHKSA